MKNKKTENPVGNLELELKEIERLACAENKGSEVNMKDTAGTGGYFTLICCL